MRLYLLVSKLELVDCCRSAITPPLHDHVPGRCTRLAALWLGRAGPRRARPCRPLFSSVPQVITYLRRYRAQV